MTSRRREPQSLMNIGYPWVPSFIDRVANSIATGPYRARPSRRDPRVLPWRASFPYQIADVVLRLQMGFPQT